MSLEPPELTAISVTPRVSFDAGKENVGFVPDGNGNGNEEDESDRNTYSREMTNSAKSVKYSWKNVNAWVGPGETVDEPQEKGVLCKLKKKNKVLLKNVSGQLNPGELVAVMGASGAGKSTLMDVLTFRNSGSVKVSGVRAINGVAIDSNALTSFAAYVQQEDLFIGVLTVREHLTFQARVRMDTDVSYEERMKRVDEVIEELGLAKCADSRIGTKWFKGISGGEKRRLSIATELITNPIFMCCDEPTSGLDSRTASNVISILKYLAKKDKTIVCTIHQPSSSLFAQFDKIILMTEGRIAWLGSAEDSLEFMEGLGYHCPEHYNPADFLIETVAVYDAESGKKVHEICDAYEESPEAKKFDVKNMRRKSMAGDLMHKTSVYKASWGNQFIALLKRSWIAYIRDPMVLKMRILQTIVLGLFVGVIYFQEDIYNADGIQNLSGAIFMLLCSLTYQCVFGVLDTFCSELPVFLREHFNGMYRTDVYYLSKLIVEIPFFFLLPTIYTTIAYFMVGFENDWNLFLKTVGILIMVNYICSGIGYCLSCVAGTVGIALLLAPVSIFPFFLFGGFLVRPDTGVVFLRWIQYISWFFYGYESLAIVHLENLDHLQCNRASNSTCPQNGLEVLRSLNFDQDAFSRDILAMAGLGLAVNLMGYLALLSKTRR